MKVIHLCLNGPFTENWGYQENVLSKYHAKSGNHVAIIAQNAKHLNSGAIAATDSEDYVNQDGVRVIRVQKAGNRIRKISDVFPNYDVYSIIKAISPDMIMVHGLIGNLSALQIRKYVRKDNAACTCVVDIHQDYHNSPLPKNVIKLFILRAVHRYLNRKMYPFYKRIYYVAPSTRLLARSYYNAPENKLELLPLGCDPEYVQLDHREQIRQSIRDKYGIGSNDILICHGGKLDHKKATEELIQAIKLMHENNGRIKLILFGAFSQSYEPRIRNVLLGSEEYIHYAGHLSQQDYYNIYLASDIAVFPGGQSVLWQQAIACGLALVVNAYTGTEYLNLGGNIKFLDTASVDEIRDKLTEIIDSGEYILMKSVALEKGLAFFSYARIAQQVLDCANAGHPV